MEIKKSIQNQANEIFTEVVKLRRQIHANPELAFEETQTAALVTQTLTSLDIPFQANIAKTGVVATIEGKKTGKTIALRADMDALPIFEQNEVEYKSCNPGKMHACGHDVHTSSLLGTAKILKNIQEHLHGTVKLIFQPSEEKLPGGASVMIQEGVLKNPDVQKIYGQHVTPQLEAGKIGIRSGMYMASADEIYLTIKGIGGHGAQPHTTIDPIAIAAQVISTLQQVVSRRADPRTPSVLSFGKFIGMGATNIIPEEVYLEGTFRTYNENWRSTAHQMISEIVQSICGAFGAQADLRILRGYPVLCNDPEVTSLTKNAICSYVGEENVIDLDLWTAAEDFAYYTQEIPGCFYRLGTRNESKGIIHGLHTPKFNVEEQSMQISTGLMAWIAYSGLLV